jgi:trk system potassium uptake protein TrkA
MDIMIAGAGTVGYSLAQKLSFKHNVIVVDKDVQKLHKLEEDVDIMVFQGDVEDPQTYQGLPFESVDLFIAVTDSDESNLLSTLIVEDTVSIKKKIIRLKNDYFSHSGVIEKLGVDFAVFPERLTAEQVGALFAFPKANNVKRFPQTEHRLVSVRVASETDIRVADLMGEEVVLLGLERDKHFLLPSEEERVEKGDLLYLFGDEEKIKAVSHTLDEKLPSTIKKVAIFGANLLAQKIAKTLLERGLEIKMIEKNRELCHSASEYLEGRVTVINSAYDDHRLFEEEGLKNADMLIAATTNDETNIVKCIEAKEYGVEKVVAINNDKAYYGLMHQLGIVVVRGSKTGAYYAILESIVASSIVSERHFCGGEAVLFMRKIYPGSALRGKRLVNVPKECRVFVLQREVIRVPETMAPLEEGDTIVVVGKTEDEEMLERWIYTR